MTIRIGARWVRPALRVESMERPFRLVAGRLPVGNVLLRLFCTGAALFPGVSTGLAVYAMDGRAGGALLAGAVVQLLFTPLSLFFVWLGGAVTEHWKVFEVDGVSGHIVARAGGRLLWFSRSLELSVSEFRSADVALQRDADDAAFRIELDLKRRAPRTGDSDDTVESIRARLEVDRIPEAVELVERLRTALGWEGSEVLDRNDRELRFRLRPVTPRR